MTAHFERVAIVGVGLLGASLGLAMKQRGMAQTIRGVGRRQSSLDTASERGAIDESHLEIEPAVKDADLVVIATPASLVIPKLDEIRAACSDTCIVTDVASTKRQICAYADQTWPAPRRFVGSHPMAGSEKFGPEHGNPYLYEGHTCLVEENPNIDQEARETIVNMWQNIGAEVVPIDPERHDDLLARTSHLPHVAASALAQIAAEQGDIRSVIGNGFRDTTRIAAARPEIWRDITLTNRDALLQAIEELHDHLKAFEQALAENDEAAIERYFQNGANARKKAVDES